MTEDSLYAIENKGNYRMRFVSIALFVCLPLLFVGWAESSRPTGGVVRAEDAVQPATDARFSRNMANSVDKNIPAEWSVEENARKNINWAVKIGNHPDGYIPPPV